MSAIKNVRLNKESRKQILRSMLEAFEKQYFLALGKNSAAEYRLHLDKIKDEALKDLWRKTYGPIQMHLNAIPKGLVSTASFGVAKAGTGDMVYLTNPDFPGTRSGADIALDQEEYEAVFSGVVEAEKSMRSFADELKDLEQKIQPVLESVNTTKQLVELWPSAEKHIPASILDPDTGINLPALNIRDLDAKISG